MTPTGFTCFFCKNTVEDPIVTKIKMDYTKKFSSSNPSIEFNAKPQIITFCSKNCNVSWFLKNGSLIVK